MEWNLLTVSVRLCLSLSVFLSVNLPHEQEKTYEVEEKTHEVEEKMHEVERKTKATSKDILRWKKRHFEEDILRWKKRPFPLR